MTIFNHLRTRSWWR